MLPSRENDRNHSFFERKFAVTGNVTNELLNGMKKFLVKRKKQVTESLSLLIVREVMSDSVKEDVTYTHEPRVEQS